MSDAGGFSSLPPVPPGGSHGQRGSVPTMTGASRMDTWRQNSGAGAGPGVNVPLAPVVRSQQPVAANEQVWAIVSGVLGVIQANEQISRFATKMELTRDAVADNEQRQQLHSSLTPVLMQYQEYARIPMLREIIDLAYDELVGISVLGPLWRDDDITEIMVDAWDKVTVEHNGRLMLTNVRFRDKEHARKIARDLALKVSDRALTPANPLVTAELPGARVQFVIDKVVKTGISVSVRKFRPLLGVDKLLAVGAMSEEMRDFLADAVRARANVLVSGGTGTGKTTIINALSSFIPDSERVITIEDSYELALSNTHWVALQTKEAASADDTVRITLADLLVSTLRMRPDRIIVGEIREGTGAAVMLQAANTGHDGTMTTIHANSADGALNFRMVNLARTGGGMASEVAAAEVASAINLVIQVTRESGRRFISEVAVVDPSQLENQLIRPEAVFSGTLVKDLANDTNRVEFRRCGGVRPDTELGLKLQDSGLLGRWQV